MPEAIGGTRPGEMPLLLPVTVHIYSRGNLAAALPRLYIFVRRKPRDWWDRCRVGLSRSRNFGFSHQLTEW